jgi:hypothetical protein
VVVQIFCVNNIKIKYCPQRIIIQMEIKLSNPLSYVGYLARLRISSFLIREMPSIAISIAHYTTLDLMWPIISDYVSLPHVITDKLTTHWSESFVSKDYDYLKSRVFYTFPNAPSVVKFSISFSKLNLLDCTLWSIFPNFLVGCGTPNPFVWNYN